MKYTVPVSRKFFRAGIVMLFFTFSVFSVSAQVKIGDNPQNIDSSSLLELESTDKAVVLSRITSAQMEAISPLQGAVVYNTDEQCVFYYDGSKWINLCRDANGFSIIDNGDNTYTVNDGINPEFTFSTNTETITTITQNDDGTYTYINEAGEPTIIATSATGTSTFSITDNGDNTYTFNDGTIPAFTLSANQETITNIVQNANGTFTYTNEAGEETIIANGSGTNSLSITNNGDNTYTVNDGTNPAFTITATPETVTSITQNGNGTFTYTNEAGEETIITNGSGTGTGSLSITDNGDNTYTVNDGTNPAFTITATPETITSIVQNSDGTYTYTNEAGNESIITSSALTITDNGDNTYTVNDGVNPAFTIAAAPETITSIVQNADSSYTYTNEAGDESIILSSALTITDNGDNTYTVNDGVNPAFTIAAAPETITSIVQNADGSYTYTNEAGDESIIASSALSITDNGDNTYTVNDGTNPAFTIIATPETVTSFVQNADGTYTYTNEAGDETVIAPSALTILDNGDNTYTVNDGSNPAFTITASPETITSIAQNADGTYTYTNEAGDETIIATNALSVTDNGDNTYTVNDGTNPEFTISATPETVTSITENANGTYTYQNEAGDETIIAPLAGSNEEGSVFFADDANGLAENNVQFFWDNANERLGLGTNTSLTDKLTVAGTIGVSDGSASEPSYRFSADPDTGIYSSAADELGFSVGGNEKMRLNNKGLFLNQALPLDPSLTDMPLVLRANAGELMGFQLNTGELGWVFNIEEQNVSGGVQGGLRLVEFSKEDRLFIENERPGDPNNPRRMGINTRRPEVALHVVGRMRVTDLPTSSGSEDVVTVDQFGNFHRASSLTAKSSNLSTRIAARWMNSLTTVSLINGQAILPIFGSEDFKDGGTGYYDENVNELEVKTRGRYEITATIALRGNVTSDGKTANTYARIAVNAVEKGAISVAASNSLADVDSVSSIHISDILELDAGDKITITLHSNANSSTIDFAGSETSNFTIVKQ